MYEKNEGTHVHLQNIKLRILINKIKADTLIHVKAGLNFELTKVPMTLTYEQALATFCYEVNHKNPPQMVQASSNRERRSLIEMNSQDGRGRGRGRG